jgi:hypothetical protein
MTAKNSSAKKRTLVVSKSTLQRARSSAKQQAAPSRPKVTGGFQSYGRTPKGKPVVNRIAVGQRLFASGGRDKKWYVLDFEEGIVDEKGYSSKGDAIAVAKRIRDSLPTPYSRSPF